MVTIKCLEEIVHPQLTTALKTDNIKTRCIINGTVKQRRSKAIYMIFYWLRDQSHQGQYQIFWDLGKYNLCGYQLKHHPGS